MRFLKQFVSFTFIITALLLSYITYSLVTKLQDSYMKKVLNDYSVFIVSTTPLVTEEFTQIGGIKVEKIESIPKEQIISEYKNKISPESLALLQTRLPNFYQIYLQIFPNSAQIERIKQDLLTHTNITKVEVFSQNHDQIDSLLNFSNQITMILFGVVAFFSFVVLQNQIKIWFFEHNERLYIMHLHGAGTLYSSFSIIKLAFVSSIVATVISFSLLFFLSTNTMLIFDKSLESIAKIELNYGIELIKLFGISFAISTISILGVILKHKIKII